MDSWPSNQRDGPLPQDATTHSMAGAIDLSRRQREALVNAGTAEALNGTPGSDCVSRVPMGDRRDSPPRLVWPADRTELQVPDGPVRTKGEIGGEACFAQLGHGKSATASQQGGQKVERHNGSVHPRQWDGCAAGSWGRGPCTGGVEGGVAMQGCYAVNGGHFYGTGGAVCTSAVSPGAREALSLEPRSPTRENPISTVPDATRTGSSGEESGGSAALAGQVRPRRDHGDEGLDTELYGASPRPGASPSDNDGIWGNHLDAAVGCHLKEMELSTCSLRTVKSKAFYNVIPHPPGQHGSVDAEASKTPMSLQSGVCDVGDVQVSLETPAWSRGEQGTKVAGDVQSRQQHECVVVLPRTCSSAQPSLATTRPASGLPDTSPPSGGERDDSRSLGTARVGRGGTRKYPGNGRVTAKKPRSARKRRRNVQVGQPTLFGPQEPEIALRYASLKVERRCSAAADTFTPYVHLEKGEFSVCTVVNSPEEERARMQEGRPQVDMQFSSSAVPTSSCLLLGRLAVGAGTRPRPQCCLCHRGSNALELGDLHGPYRPIGAGPPRLPSSTPHAPEEEESNQSDSSCSLQGGALKRGSPSETAHGRLSGRDGDLTPPAKRPKEGALTDGPHCPGAGGLDAREYWIHEDCGVWSPGVFLVRGKLYGLEEAVQFSQETVCSLCHADGATLGCFFKTCPSKFHYTCAVQADCVLNEENFSMKCPTHKGAKESQHFPGSRMTWLDGISVSWE